MQADYATVGAVSGLPGARGAVPVKHPNNARSLIVELGTLTWVTSPLALISNVTSILRTVVGSSGFQSARQLKMLSSFADMTALPPCRVSLSVATPFEFGGFGQLSGSGGLSWLESREPLTWRACEGADEVQRSRCVWVAPPRGRGESRVGQG